MEGGIGNNCRKNVEKSDWIKVYREIIGASQDCWGEVSFLVEPLL